MDWIREEGRCVDEALEKALRRLGANREDVLFEVVEENHPLLGFLGASSVQIRVARKEEDRQLQIGIEVLSDLLRCMQVGGTVQGRQDDQEILLTIESEQGGLLIGRHGETIEALEYLVNRMVNRVAGEAGRNRVVIDTEGYRQRRVERLERMARKAAQQVKASGEAVSLAPMNARDRRVVHLTLQNDQFVETVSFGDGDSRKVTISPKAGTQDSSSWRGDR